MDWTKHLKECDVTRIKSKAEKRSKKKEAKFDDMEFEQMIEVFLFAFSFNKSYYCCLVLLIKVVMCFRSFI